LYCVDRRLCQAQQRNGVKVGLAEDYAASKEFEAIDEIEL